MNSRDIGQRVGELERLVRWLSSRSERALEAVFVDTASSPASSLRVTVPGYDDGEHTFGPVVWSPLGNALPAAGDRCLVAESDDGSWWVLAWWSGAQGTPAPLLSAGPSGSITSTSTSPVALTSGPSITIARNGTYLVRWGLLIQSAAAGLFQGVASVAKNGTAIGPGITFIGQTTFDGASVFGEQKLTLVAGDVLTLAVYGGNPVSTTYSSGTISATL